MHFSDLIQTRYSVRAYHPSPVEQAKLDAVLEAARLAPTAANRQPLYVIVIHTNDRVKDLKRIYKGDWFAQAPLVLCVCGKADAAWTRRQDAKCYVDVDAAIVMDHIILAATEQGLGTCWIGAFDPNAAREILELPDDIEPIAFTPLGYAADAPRAKTRKALEEIVKYERW